MNEIREESTTCPLCGQLLPEHAARRRYLFHRGLEIALVVVAVAALGVLAWSVYSHDRALPYLTQAGTPAVASQGADRGTGTAQEPADIQTGAVQPSTTSGSVSLADQVQPPGGYPLPASYGDLGPKLVAAGVIDYDRLAQLYLQRGQPLTSLQVAILKEGSDSQVVIDADNSYFLLNFFWAVGLANQNPLLEEGPMMDNGREGVGGFASTGGWTLGTKPATELYSSLPLIPLTAEQQARVEEVAGAIYRPCCGNPTSFPDCNHGMAMLGLLQLMAADGASVDEMFEAAKYVNGFWFPQQTLELALYYQMTEGTRFAALDARRAFGAESFSAEGFQSRHRWLVQNDLLEQAPAQGASCGV